MRRDTLERQLVAHETRNAEQIRSLRRELELARRLLEDATMVDAAAAATYLALLRDDSNNASGSALDLGLAGLGLEDELGVGAAEEGDLLSRDVLSHIEDALNGLPAPSKDEPRTQRRARPGQAPPVAMVPRARHSGTNSNLNQSGSSPSKHELAGDPSVHVRDSDELLRRRGIDEYYTGPLDAAQQQPQGHKSRCTGAGAAQSAFVPFHAGATEPAHEGGGGSGNATTTSKAAGKIVRLFSSGSGNRKAS